MRTLGVVEFVTLDGVMQGFDSADPDDPGFGHGGWGRPYMDAVAGQEGTRGQESTAAYLFGRKTYERMASFWPTQPDDNPMAAHLNRTPKYVATRTLSTVDWTGARVLEGELPEAVRALKQGGDGAIVVLGSGELVQQLVAAGLVDRFTLFLHPLVLGAGKRLFRELAQPLPLELGAVKQTGTGVLILDYAVARRQAGA